jgi:hypothetical protein
VPTVELDESVFKIDLTKDNEMAAVSLDPVRNKNATSARSRRSSSVPSAI